jgi:ABC-type transport system involved in multi-copper enzyme maturation permease subunit
MSGAHFAAILRVEVIKLFRHPGGRIGLVLAFLLGIAGPLAMLWVGSSNAVVNGAPVGETLTYTTPQGIVWSLRMRNFSHIMRLFAVALAAITMAGELTSRTLREALLRPVPRWAIPVAKFAALTSYVLVTGAVTWIASTAVGLVLLDSGDGWGSAAEVLAYSLVGDLTVVAVALLVAVITRSVAGSIVLVVILSVANWFSRMAMALIENVFLQTQQDGVVEFIGLLRPWSPTYAVDGWFNQSVPYLSLGSDWYPPLVTAAFMVAACVGLTAVRLSRIDVH